MSYTEKPQIEFYQKLGELFYAIAASDKVVRDQEHKALSELIKKEWTSQDDYTDKFGTDAAYQMEIVFDWFEYEQMRAEDCFESFSDYVKEHPGLFSEDRAKLIWRTANAIANAFSGKNKSELIMLTKLKMLLQKSIH